MSEFALKGAAAVPARGAAEDREARGGAGSTSSDGLRDPHLRPDERDRRVRRLPEPLPALALRHGVRALAKSYEYGLSKIYEMVINNNPSYAYLLEGNSLVDQKLVMAHVYAHVDFFKNNYCFRTPTSTRRTTIPSKRPRYDPNGAGSTRWPTTARACAARGAQGINKVEEFIDHCLSLENLIDPTPLHRPAPKAPPRTRRRRRRSRACKPRSTWSLHQPRGVPRGAAKKIEAEREKAKKFPEHPERDVLQFLLDTRRSSAGSTTCSRSSARRPTTSRRSGRPRS
jgi:hypothetical protein